METTIGGDRLGSGNKQQLSYKNYERSTHDLSYLWRSTMAAGTLVPFMSKLALPGDTWDIELNTEVLTLPTVGPLFGSYKLQLDIFEVPIRLYNAKLHMNKLGIGMAMNQILLPQIDLAIPNKTQRTPPQVQSFDDNEHINPSSLLKYLGISGIGRITGTADPVRRQFNAVPLLAYWDIFKNYYSNKQEENAYMIHTDFGDVPNLVPLTATVAGVDALNPATVTLQGGQEVWITFDASMVQPDFDTFIVGTAGGGTLTYAFKDICNNPVWDDVNKIASGQVNNDLNNLTGFSFVATAWATGQSPVGAIKLASFPLENIDKMREYILQDTGPGAFTIDEGSADPYGLICVIDSSYQNTSKYTQEGLALKTYQSDLFNNWINTEWIEGETGVNELTKVATTGDSFTIDALNIAQKVYVMLNRIAVSGGTYDDWLDAVYTHERVKSIESPIYMGSLIKELAFQEVINNSGTADQPLGTLAGRGVLTNKHKGGKVVIKVNEPSYIMGIVSLTPRIEYSQGNSWDMNLKTLDDLHKPALDAIGFQDLVTDQLLWTDTEINSNTGAITYKSIGKQPAWINYMSSVNKTFGNFAIETDSMFMTLNRRYSKGNNGQLLDPTTYIDPSKYNNIFAETSLDSQNFWTQIAVNITARRKMSAKVIPNL